MMMAALAALLMCVSFSSCVQGSPEERMISALEEILDFYKNTHISSVSDLKEFIISENDLDEKMDDKYGVINKSELQFSEEQQKRHDELKEAIDAETERITLEAADYLDQIDESDFKMEDFVDDDDIDMLLESLDD